METAILIERVYAAKPLVRADTCGMVRGQEENEMAYDSEHSVNVAECLALADFLEALPPERFSMRRFAAEEPCGTVACIAGWCAINAGGVVNNKTGGVYMGDLHTHEIAADRLGIDHDAAGELFYDRMYIATSATQAARVLRHLAATGNVDWSVAL